MPDEQHGVDGFGDVGVAEPDRLAAFLASGPHPLGQLVAGVGVVDDDGLHEVVLACEEQLAAGLGGGDGGGGHELGDLADGVGPDGVVVEVLGHAARRDLLGAPGVERVVDERGALEQPVVVGLDVEPAEADGEQTRAPSGSVCELGRRCRRRARSRARRTRAGSSPRSKSSMSTSKVHWPSRWSNSAPGVSKPCASWSSGDGEDVARSGRRGSRRRGR